jgi:hypothetical protein
VWKNTAGTKVPFMKVRWFNYGVGERADGTLEAHPDEVWYRLSLKTDEPWKKIKLTRRAAAVGIISDTKFDLHSEPLPLPTKKVKDLAKFRAWLPLEFHALYPDPPAGGDEEDDEDEKSDEEDEEDEEGEEEEEDEDTDDEGEAVGHESEQDNDDDDEEEDIEQGAEEEVEPDEDEEELEHEEGDNDEDEDGDITMTQVVA